MLICLGGLAAPAGCCPAPGCSEVRPLLLSLVMLDEEQCHRVWLPWLEVPVSAVASGAERPFLGGQAVHVMLSPSWRVLGAA